MFFLIKDTLKNEKYIVRTAIVFIIVWTLLNPSSSTAETLINYENGNLESASGGSFRYHIDDTYAALSLDPTLGFDGTGQSLQVHTLRDNFHIWWIQHPQSGERKIIPEARGCNRMSFYIKIPEEYPISSRGPDYNFNMGTYTRDPAIEPAYYLGEHYYHLWNVQGSPYPIKFIANERPQVEVSSSVTIETNPEAWNYYDGFNRFYLMFLPLTESPLPLPFDAWIDEVKFYSTPEPENDETIASISCTYQGNGRFQIGWHGNSQYEHNGHRYEVRYSTTPITNANYSAATIAPGGPFRKLEQPGLYNFIQADFTIPNMEGDRYYFAIRDIDADIAYVSKIDYPLPSAEPEKVPAAPGNLSIRP